MLCVVSYVFLTVNTYNGDDFWFLIASAYKNSFVIGFLQKLLLTAFVEMRILCCLEEIMKGTYCL